MDSKPRLKSFFWPRALAICSRSCFGGRLVDRVVFDDNAIAPGAFHGDQARLDIEQHFGRIALQRVAAAATTPGVRQQQVAGLHLDVIELGGQQLLGAVLSDERLLAARTRLAAVDTPRVCQPSIVVYGDLSGLQEPVANAQAIAAAELAGAARVGERFIHLDAQREVALEKLVRHVGEGGPQRVAVGSVAERFARNAAEGDLVKLVPLAVAVDSRNT